MHHHLVGNNGFVISGGKPLPVWKLVKISDGIRSHWAALSWSACLRIHYWLRENRFSPRSKKSWFIFKLIHVLYILCNVRIATYISALKLHLHIVMLHHLIVTIWQDCTEGLNTVGWRSIGFDKFVIGKSCLMHVSVFCLWCFTRERLEEEPSNFLWRRGIRVLHVMIAIKVRVSTLIQCLGSGYETMVCAERYTSYLQHKNVVLTP